MPTPTLRTPFQRNMEQFSGSFCVIYAAHFALSIAAAADDKWLEASTGATIGYTIGTKLDSDIEVCFALCEENHLCRSIIYAYNGNCGLKSKTWDDDPSLKRDDVNNCVYVPRSDSPVVCESL